MADSHSSHHSPAALKNPGSYQVSSGVRGLFLLFAAIGVLSFLFGVSKQPQHAWASFVQNHFYFLSLGIGGLFFASVQWASSAMWSAPVRRLAESFTSYLPVAAVAFIVLCLGGLPHLYEWTHAEAVQGDPMLSGKAGYLNVSFFVIRNLIVFGAWIYFAKKMIGNSLAQDASADFAYTQKNQRLSPAFLIVFAVTFTMMSFDLLMSIDARWFSTIYGVYCFAGLFYSTLALVCLLTLKLKCKGHLDAFVNDNHYHDLGKFMFAFTVFWAYIGFSQFMLIWYANLPEETGYYIRRLSGGWIGVSLFLLVGKFILPFFMLLPRDAKRNPKILGAVACFMMVAQWIDMLWLVQPEFYSEGPRLNWIDLGVTLGFTGLFGFSVSRFLGRHNVVAIGDPRLIESVTHHHQ